MRELSRFELAAVKRTAQNIKTMRKQKEKLQAKIDAAQQELDRVNNSIAAWEEPIIQMTGGYTSEQVLNGVEEAPVMEERVPDSDYREPFADTIVDPFM